MPLYGVSGSFPPCQPRSAWVEGPPNFNYPSPGACGNPYGKFTPQPNPVNFAPFMPLPWGYSSALNCQVSGNTSTYPVAGTQTTLNDGSFVSPSQTLNVPPAHSPNLPSSPASTLWPHQDSLCSTQLQPLPPVQMPPPRLSPSTGPEHSTGVQRAALNPSDDIDGYQTTLQFARGRWGGAGLKDQASRDAAILGMRELGLSYKDIKRIGCFTDALATLRGRHRILTTKSEDRVRKPPWQPRDVRLLLPRNIAV